MSCHDIGRGMNSVVKKVVEMYDANEVTLEAARKIIAAARKGVYWCDGNEDEAVEFIRRSRCGRCLRIMDSGSALYSVWDISTGNIQVLDNNKEEILASDGLCPDCFDIVINRAFNDEGAGAREREYIETHNEERRWRAE